MGTSIFTVLASSDQDTNVQRLHLIKWSSQGTAIIITILLLMQFNVNDLEHLKESFNVSQTIRPLFYGVIIFICIEMLQRLKRRKSLRNNSHFTKDLTRRELEVFDLVIKGYSNLEIANELYIAESTVKKHVKQILSKTGCENRAVLKALISNEHINK